MSKDPEGQANKTSQNISSKPDDLVKGGTKDQAELTESELKAVSGGEIFIKFGGIGGESTTDGHDKWIELQSAVTKTTK